MPQPNQDAASAGVISEQAPAASESTAVEQTTETQTSSTSIMDRLGVPQEVQAELKSRQAPAEAETPPETAAEAEPEIESSATPQEENPNEEQPETHGDWPESAKKRLAKERGKRGKAEEKAEALEAEVERLRSVLDSTQPVTVAPHSGDILANVQNEQQLAQVVHEAKFTRDWCRRHPQGVTVDEGKESERFISPEEIADTLGKAEDALAEEVPRKYAQLQERKQVDSIARTEHPSIFDKNTEDYQVAVALMRQLPALASHPAKNLIVGDYIVGVKARLAKARQSGKTADVPPELLRKTPPLAPHVPAAQRGGEAQPSRKKIDQAMNHVVEGDGNREDIMAVLRAKREAASKASNPRSAVLV